MPEEGPIQYEQFKDDDPKEAKRKARKPRHTAFLNDDTRGGFFKKKKKRVIKKKGSGAGSADSGRDSESAT